MTTLRYYYPEGKRDYISRYDTGHLTPDGRSTLCGISIGGEGAIRHKAAAGTKLCDVCRAKRHRLEHPNYRQKTTPEEERAKLEAWKQMTEAK